MLEVSGLTKTYGGVLAVRELSFSARSGQVIGLLGPNGSGKSTSIRVLTGLLRATRGRVSWNGIDIQQQLLTYQSRLGYVPEEPHLYQYLTAPEYLELVGGLRGIDASTLRARIDRYLQLFRLDTDRYAPLSSFSKGMRQKVLLSAALLHDPDIVVLDEPCSGLDVASTLILRTLVRALAERGKVIVYSSHVLGMVEKVCSDVIILHEGRVVAHDSVERLRELQHAASLEQVFKTLAVEENVEDVGTWARRLPWQPSVSRPRRCTIAGFASTHRPISCSPCRSSSRSSLSPRCTPPSACPLMSRATGRSASRTHGRPRSVSTRFRWRCC